MSRARDHAAPELLSAQDQEAFFKKCLALRGPDGAYPLTWKKVRAELKQCMIQRVIRSKSEQSGGTYQPLSYYEKQGYCVDDIEAKAEMKENPVLGPCYLGKFAKSSASY